MPEVIVRPTNHDIKKVSWFQKQLREWHTLFMDIRHWGPLAIGEVIDYWCLMIRPNGKIGGGEREANHKLQEKPGHDTNSDVS